ncbi:hypothetical protein I8751_22230 [Nostocaceae cyanobacterium CENA357]|uniref:Uncharacterized protein n=1 Tax=Atlanticothrix silvestris CENA357 TaxID=1725252 RepID=A0A8J7HHW3_9CYAN|nr:hypothetical protein [Atlanticothrix silvestris]MBH8555013.1 hypothetical protein [Atlanticothrix silvestris CENA357]
MNYQKLDPALAMALNNAQAPEAQGLEVFIHTESILQPTATTVLKSFGVNDVSSNKDIFTAILSPSAISQLSEQPWVKYLKLSQNLRLVNNKLGSRKLGV